MQNNTATHKTVTMPHPLTYKPLKTFLTAHC